MDNTVLLVEDKVSNTFQLVPKISTNNSSLVKDFGLLSVNRCDMPVYRGGQCIPPSKPSTFGVGQSLTYKNSYGSPPNHSDYLDDDVFHKPAPEYEPPPPLEFINMKPAKPVKKEKKSLFRSQSNKLAASPPSPPPQNGVLKHSNESNNNRPGSSAKVHFADSVDDNYVRSQTLKPPPKDRPLQKTNSTSGIPHQQQHVPSIHHQFSLDEKLSYWDHHVVQSLSSQQLSNDHIEGYNGQ